MSLCHGRLGGGGPAASGCADAWRSVYFVNTVPLVGFGSVVEYAMMFLARAARMRAQLDMHGTI